jgi:hypothetical protein
MRFKRRKALFDSYFCACARVFPKGVGYRMELSALTGRFLIGVAWENAMIAHAQPYVTARVSATLIVLTALALGIVGSLALPSPAKGIGKTSTAAPPAPVRVVNAPDLNKDCAEQTWPYLAAHCLTRAAGSPAIEPSQPQTNPVAAAPQTVTPVNPFTIAEPPAQRQTAGSALNTAAAASAPGASGADATKNANLADVSQPVLPVPPGAEPQPAGERLASAPDPDAATAAPLIGAAAAVGAMTNAKTQPRAERRRRATHAHRGFSLFGFRVVRLPF